MSQDGRFSRISRSAEGVVLRASLLQSSACLWTFMRLLRYDILLSAVHHVFLLWINQKHFREHINHNPIAIRYNWFDCIFVWLQLCIRISLIPICLEFTCKIKTRKKVHNILRTTFSIMQIAKSQQKIFALNSKHIVVLFPNYNCVNNFYLFSNYY